MAQMFVAVEDAVSRSIAHAFGKSGGRLPWYARPEGSETIQGATGEAAELEADRLGLLFPNRVTTRAN
jgi:hypothetical protein